MSHRAKRARKVRLTASARALPPRLGSARSALEARKSRLRLVREGALAKDRRQASSTLIQRCRNSGGMNSTVVYRGAHIVDSAGPVPAGKGQSGPRKGKEKRERRLPAQGLAWGRRFAVFFPARLSYGPCWTGRASPGKSGSESRLPRHRDAQRWLRFLVFVHDWFFRLLYKICQRSSVGSWADTLE